MGLIELWRVLTPLYLELLRDGRNPKSLPSQPYFIGIYIIARKSQSYFRAHRKRQ
ncbi:MAG: hypothetical protein K2M46_05515 [Lachnospiraceae bacterium]|nr:hypothetical protein [Lachnospiraceae bacterium]